MEAYRLLMKEYQPVNRTRSLELFHNMLTRGSPRTKELLRTSSNMRNALSSTRRPQEKRCRIT